MKTKPLFHLTSIATLQELMDSKKEIYVYGAGYYLNIFLQEIEKLDKSYHKKIKCIFVTNADANPERIRNIPICTYHPDILTSGDCVLLTLGHRYTDEIYGLLCSTGADISEIDFNMFQEQPYHEVKKSIQPFIDLFPEKVTGLNEPSHQKEIIAWTCWWQGEEQAPEIVRACLESQRQNVPQGVKHVVITEKNHQDYITLPEHIYQKVENGDITLVTLSDMIRSCLLYKYGGFWMDSTLLVCKPLEKSILDHPFYTRNLPETQYYANAMWSIWFLYTRPGNKLFRFVMEGFFNYFSTYNKSRYYFMMDYLIAIACNTFKDIKEQLMSVPYNNESALELLKHIMEPFDGQKIKNYIKDSSVQKLTYKMNLSEMDNLENTIYRHIIKNLIG